MQQDYYSALARLIIPHAEHDPALRKRIYALARDRLQQQLGWDGNGLNSTASAKQLVALEGAIARIEANVETHNARRVSSFAANIPDRQVEIIPPGQEFSPLPDSRYEIPAERKIRSASSPMRWILPLIGAAAVAVAVYIAVERAIYTVTPLPQGDEATMGKSPAGHRLDLPLPNAYGVYALVGGSLRELEPLPFKFPDHGPAITRMLSSASKTQLSNGAIQFVAFKRELANNAPDTVMVRVVAHLKPGRSTGKQDTAADSWLVRNAAYEMKVAPVEDHPAIILIRPTDSAFVFSAGRYALMLKGTAYDFGVEGPITDPAQCVERSADLSVIDYLPCR